MWHIVPAHHFISSSQHLCKAVKADISYMPGSTQPHCCDKPTLPTQGNKDRTRATGIPTIQKLSVMVAQTQTRVITILWQGQLDAGTWQMEGTVRAEAEKKERWPQQR